MGLSRVEEIFLNRSGYELQYTPEEKTGIISVDNFPLLGKLTALRFIEWIQNNPEGVVSLPTGKTPEYFIKYVQYYLNTWSSKKTEKELEVYSVDCSSKPDIKQLHFVQMDEFYPIDPSQHNSFYYYVNTYYIEGFGFDRKKAMLINCSDIGLPAHTSLADVWPGMSVDLSLRFRRPRTNLERMQRDVIEEVDQWCCMYEERIHALGGIGFFLGGIGPDGHVAFNIRGSDHESTTRLTQINYETQAAAASDLGGIEVARKRHAITIGLSTITYNKDTASIIIAAGETKSKVVADAVEEKEHVRYPATVLHTLSNARFYITASAGSRLSRRRYDDFRKKTTVTWQEAEEIIAGLSVRKKKPVCHLSREDISGDRYAHMLPEYMNISCGELAQTVYNNIEHKIDAGAHPLTDTRFLHTSPHHDDIMLGYLPCAIRNLRQASNTHFFAYMTSGFNAVTNHYALKLVKSLRSFLAENRLSDLLETEYFISDDPHYRNRDVWQYLDGVAAQNSDMKREGEARRLLRIVMDIYNEPSMEKVQDRLYSLSDYFLQQYPGKKDAPDVQLLKGMIREWEADCLWGYLGFDSRSIRHMRLGFYKGDMFTEEPDVTRDVLPIVELLKECNPDIVTVALDPEGSGPDTHYKVMQAIAESLREYEEKSGRNDIEVWGYRNIWYRFKPSEANMFVPVSLNMFALMESAFFNAFQSQKNASFPSSEYDGPFSELAQKIQVEQYQVIKTCMGRKYFNDHPHPLIRATRGFVFLKKMSLKEFYNHARQLKRSIEDE